MQEYTNQERSLLLKLAKDAIEFGLSHQKAMQIDPNDFSKHLQQQRATFVTLHIEKNLRGCIGSLIAHQPLVVDIAHNAFLAAFSDQRFPPLTVNEFPKLEIHISVLSTPEPMKFNSEEELLEQIRPNIDGLIISDGIYHGTFLPSVWEELPSPAAFLKHLKLKAGLPQNYWSDTLIVERYTTESMP